MPFFYAKQRRLQHNNFFHSYFSFKTDECSLTYTSNSAYQVTEGMDYPQILYKVCRQGSHFVFRFPRIGATSSASPPSTSSGTPTPRVPHGCMFELHKILEDWITENAARMLGLASRKWSTSLVKVYCN